MNHIATARRTAPGAALLILMMFVLLATGCQRGNAEPGFADAPLAGSTVGGPFSLVDQDGKRVRDTDFNGRYRLVYFGFANCPDVCPVDLAVAGQGLREFEKSSPDQAARVQPIFITVDPARDTPQVLKSYVANFHPRLIGLTGTEGEIEGAKKEYAIWSQKEEREGSAAGAYAVNHSRMFLLFGPQGEPIAIVPHDKGPEGVAEELARWVQ